MESSQVVRKITTARYLGDLASAVRAVKRAGANWADTVALGWRLAAEFDQASINVAREIPVSQVASQQWQPQGDARPLSATAKAA